MSTTKLTYYIAATFTLASLVAASAWADSPPPAVSATSIGDQFNSQIRPLLQTYCYQCHGHDKEEGGLSFADMKDGAASLRYRTIWRRATKRVKSGDMPPEDAKVQLPAQEQKKLLAWLDTAVGFLDLDPRHRDPGPGLVRRLNRTEYDNTIRDLIGIKFDSRETVGMPDEEVVDGFDTLASATQLSASTLEKYMAAADTILDTVFGRIDAPPQPEPAKNSKPKEKPKAKNGEPLILNPQQAREAIVFVRPGDGKSPHDAGAEVLSRFVRKAYRRPVRPVEIDRLLPLFESTLASGKSFDQSIRAALKPVLVSPYFLFRIEANRAAEPDHAGVPITDHELAVRVSYFLWSTMPDDALSSLADQGKLSDPSILRGEIDRMLADPKAHALTDNFAEQWLHLNKLSNARPTTEFFPTFTSKLRKAMHDETSTFFDHLRTEDRSVLDLIDANYTYVNADLATNYGLEGVTGPEMRRIELKPTDHRGGLLGMGSVLALTSHTFRTSPTQRGKYVLDVIFGTPPPPPPANVGTISDDGKKGKKGEIKTFRQQLAAHATQKSCANCHAKIDPLGFALDNFDAIGRWRESTPEVPLDTAGVLPGGEKIAGSAELRKVILDRKDDFARNLAEQMLMYGIGRKTDYFDECTMIEVVDGMKKDGYKFSSLVRGIVTSPTFQQRRAAER